MQGRLLLNVVVRQRAPVLKLLARKDEALLVGRNPLLVLDLALDVLHSVRRLHLERHRLARKRLDKHLHASAQAIDSMHRVVVLNGIVLEHAPVLERPAREDEALLASWHTSSLRHPAARDRVE